VTGSNRLVRLQSCEKVMGWCTTQCKMLLFCVKTIMRESRNFELTRLKKKEKTFWPSAGDFLVCATRRVIGNEAFKNEW